MSKPTKPKPLYRGILYLEYDGGKKDGQQYNYLSPFKKYPWYKKVRVTIELVAENKVK